MKILHINRSDLMGGASIAGYRLHQGLLAQGIESRQLVGTAKTSSPQVAEIPRRHFIEHQLARLTRYRLNYLNIISSFEIPKHPFFKEADILNFHNLHCDYFNYLAVPSLLRDKPAVFTLHDMWNFTGHCAYSYDCEKWKTGCGRCPYPHTYPYILKDYTGSEWKLKKWIYRNAKIAIACPSKWLAEKAKQSMLKHFPIHHIPYSLDTEVYAPLDKEQCRAVLGIPPQKHILMFGAEYLTDPRKGGDLLIEALQLLPDSLKNDCFLLTLGEGNWAISEQVGIPALNLGYLSNDRLKVVAFSVADLFLFPTRADNLPLVLQESLACGTPMVSFNIGGVSDIIRPTITGYVVQPEDTQDFCGRIIELLEDHALRQKMSTQCREIAVKEYAMPIQAQRYIQLYRDLLAQSPLEPENSESS